MVFVESCAVASGHVTVAQLLNPRLSFLKSHSSTGSGLHGLTASGGRRLRSAQGPFSASIDNHHLVEKRLGRTIYRRGPRRAQRPGALPAHMPPRELFPKTQRPSAPRRGCWNPRDWLPVCPGSCVTEHISPSVKWVNTRPCWAGLTTPDNTLANPTEQVSNTRMENTHTRPDPRVLFHQAPTPRDEHRSLSLPP